MEEEKQPEQKFEWGESKQVTPEIYGNFFNTTWTLFDVRFQVGQLIAKKEGDLSAGFVVEKRGAVTIAWPQVKLLRDTLVDLVARYEKANGEIKPLVLPPGGPLAP
jgi:hypothetical protein